MPIFGGLRALLSDLPSSSARKAGVTELPENSRCGLPSKTSLATSAFIAGIASPTIESGHADLQANALSKPIKMMATLASAWSPSPSVGYAAADAAKRVKLAVSDRGLMAALIPFIASEPESKGRLFEIQSQQTLNADGLQVLFSGL